MRKVNQFYKIIALLTMATSAMAQDTVGSFSEKNLSDNSPSKSQIIKPTPLTTPASNSGISNSIETILLNKKATSLMFDDEQNSNIERAVNAFKNIGSPDYKKFDTTEETAASLSKKYERNEKSYIYLGSILYLTPKDWVVWINNQKITSTTNKIGSEIYVKSVEKDKVKIYWTLSVSKWKILSGNQSEESAPKINAKNQVEVNFELKPNQTFVLSNGVVVEGRITIEKAPEKLPNETSVSSIAPQTSIVIPPDSTPAVTPQDIVK